MHGFNFVLRPFRILFVLILAGIVYWLTREYAASLVTCLAIFDLDITEFLKDNDN